MIYADNNGSMPLLPSVKEYLMQRLDGPFANPNAIHSLGQRINRGMEKCRRTCANILGATPEQIMFNSGASEGIAHVFYSILGTAPKNGKDVIITSGIEHSAVVNNCKKYEARGYRIKTVKTLENGTVDLADLKNLLDEDVALVSIMAANNETGVIQPYQEIAAGAHSVGALFFSDTTQYIGKIEFNFAESGMDFAVMSSHKVGSLIGSGAILAKDPSLLSTDYLPGGGQENNHRGGTQNYIGVECMTVALDTFNQFKNELKNVAKYRETFENTIKEKIS
jgi:cysteine desulfurase